jgi:hypothetical protein
MDGHFERGKVPLALPGSFREETLRLRNKLLTFRFRKYGKTGVDETVAELALEPRLAQVIMPIAGIVENEPAKERLMQFVRERNQQIIEERGESLEGYVTQALIDLWEDEVIPMKKIAEVVNEQHLSSGKYKISPRKVGSIVRNSLKLTSVKTSAGYCVQVNPSGTDKLMKAAQRYGIDAPIPSPQRSQCSRSSPSVAGQEVTE